MDYSDDAEEHFRRRPRKMAYLGDPSRRGYMQEEDISLDAIRARWTNVLKRHSELAERLSRDADKIIYERLQKEFEAARAIQTQETYLDGEQWNDGLLATIRERVHMEAERKAMEGDVNMLPGQEKITYKIGNKVICCLEGARIGILYETSYAGEPCDLYHCVLESKSFLEKMTVLEHTIPYFLPTREAENDLLSSNAMKFIDYIGEMLQAYVDRREQVRLVKELYGNQIKEIHFTLPYSLIVVVKLKYAELVSVLPTHVSVVAWPVCQPRKSSLNISSMNKKENGTLEGPTTLFYAEDALRTKSLPEAYAEIVLNLPQTLREICEGNSS
ncbi:hypothetical protein DVH24_012255 [Malus domestica]|uniref:Centromere protein O n=1 Tax=Malus domestica TaxID=3750 RepID=A0A498HTV4_MALDO|nr:hypothetical protein DVH24_012255 [Malus domestica]